MNLKEGFEHFIQSETFKEVSNLHGSAGGKYRGYKTRFYQGKLKDKAITAILELHGYKVNKTIEVIPPK